MSLVDSVDAGASRPRGAEPLPAGASQEPAGPLRRPFPWGNCVMEAVWPLSVGTGGPQGFFSCLVALLSVGIHPLLDPG